MIGKPGIPKLTTWRWVKKGVQWSQSSIAILTSATTLQSLVDSFFLLSNIVVDQNESYFDLHSKSFLQFRAKVNILG